MDYPQRSLSHVHPDAEQSLAEIESRSSCLDHSSDYEVHVQPLSDTEADEEASDDEDNDMLQYAIMLSLQNDNESEPMTCLTNGLNSDINTSNDLFEHDFDSFSHQNIDTMQVSRLTSLPLELKELICSHVFCGEKIVIKPAKDPKPKLLITWGPHLSILLLSKEFNAIAAQYLGYGEVILDLRQLRVRNITTRANPGSHVDLDNLLSAAVSLRSVCSKIMIRQGQLINCNDIETLLPALTHVELFDYKACREALRERGLSSGRIFEYAMPMITREQASLQLSELQQSLPLSICADLIYVCDTLICIPRHEPKDNDIEHAARSGINNAAKLMKNAFQSSHRPMRIEKSEGEEEEAKQNSRYRTAKQVSLLEKSYLPR